jgi:hypothetical protein
VERSLGVIAKARNWRTAITTPGMALPDD